MSFKYINPGYAFLTDDGVQISDPTYSTTGVSLADPTGTNRFSITLPSLNSCSDLWFRWDRYWYVGDNTGVTILFPYVLQDNYYPKTFDASLYSTGEGSAGVSFMTSGHRTFSFPNLNLADYNITQGKAIRYFVRLHYGTKGNCFVEYSINGSPIVRSDFSAAPEYSTSSEYHLTFYPANRTVQFFYNHISNIIISDEELSPDEQCVILPINATETDMTAGDGGIYIAGDVNQTLLQTPDTSSLLTAYGSASSITGAMVVGNPAYRTGNGINTLTALSKTASVATVHGSHALSEDSTAKIWSGWKITGTTLADLADMQFGWKAEA